MKVKTNRGSAPIRADPRFVLVPRDGIEPPTRGFSVAQPGIPNFLIFQPPGIRCLFTVTFGNVWFCLEIFDLDGHNLGTVRTVRAGAPGTPRASTAPSHHTGWINLPTRPLKLGAAPAPHAGGPSCSGPRRYPASACRTPHRPASNWPAAPVLQEGATGARQGKRDGDGPLIEQSPR